MAGWLNEDAIAVLTKQGYSDWVRGNEAIISELMLHFQLTVVRPLEGGTLSAVVHCRTREGGDVVLKASPDAAALELERQFLARVPLSTPRILGAVPGALVLEFLSGQPERGQLGDSAAVAALSRMALWSSETPGVLVDVAEMLEVIGERLMARDAALAAELAAYGSAIRERWEEQSVWCHGDLQGENVFWDGERLRAIDPLPAWAPRGLDIGYWAADPLRGRLTVRRLELLSSAFGMPLKEVVTWTTLGAAQHVSWLWHYGVGPELAVRAEKTLRDLLR